MMDRQTMHIALQSASSLVLSCTELNQSGDRIICVDQSQTSRDRVMTTQTYLSTHFHKSEKCLKLFIEVSKSAYSFSKIHHRYFLQCLSQTLKVFPHILNDNDKGLIERQPHRALGLVDEFQKWVGMGSNKSF